MLIEKKRARKEELLIKDEREVEMEASNSFLALSVMGSAFESKGMKSKSCISVLLASILASSVLLFNSMPIHVSSGVFVIRLGLSHLPPVPQ